ncbi:hypothetical protein E9229_003465 [Paeniglutamicibacter cryotolerans]|uniref:Uncharacterized protein n=1 Tax=Paeniglutamicibacter cryotolerans TaxID=670079 RepID=A0A839QLC2_9MICC|nr:hypothetical protein [Paeniglutamicibacter cryotolerans]
MIAHCERILALTEPDVCNVGGKSHGRARTFLVIIGYEQSSAIAAALAGGRAAGVLTGRGGARGRRVLHRSGRFLRLAPAVDLDSNCRAPGAEAASCRGTLEQVRSGVTTGTLPGHAELAGE